MSAPYHVAYSKSRLLATPSLGSVGWDITLLTHAWCVLIISEPDGSGSNVCSTTVSPGFLCTHSISSSVNGANIRSSLIGLLQELKDFKSFRKVPW